MPRIVPRPLDYRGGAGGTVGGESFVGATERHVDHLGRILGRQSPAGGREAARALSRNQHSNFESSHNGQSAKRPKSLTARSGSICLVNQTRTHPPTCAFNMARVSLALLIAAFVRC